jgi:iron complex outermembrane receptor protein
VTPDVNAFMSYSTGYKAGGFNSAGGTQTQGLNRIFKPETSDNWEVGMKSTWFDRRFLLNLTAYRTTLDGFQERSYDGTSFFIRNSGSVRAQGIELESQFRPSDHFSFDFSVAYLDSKFTSNPTAPGLPGCTGAANSCPRVQDLTGRTTTYAPKWQGNLGAEYNTGPVIGGFSLSQRGDMSFASGMYTTIDLNPQSRVPSQTLFGGRITLTSPNRSFTVALFGEKLTNDLSYRSKFGATLDSVMNVRDPVTGATLMRGRASEPRKWGVRIAKTF